jgi:hypothetical protein
MRILVAPLLYFSLFLPFTTHAQISLGIKGGVDFSRIINAVQGNDGSSNIAFLKSGTITQVYGGIFADIPLDTTSKLFYLRPAIEYVGAGGNMNSDGDYYNPNGFQPSTKYSLQYVQVPLEFLYSPTFVWGRPWAGFGFYGAALVSGTIKAPDGSSKSVMIGNKPTDNFQGYDFGYLFSLGLATKPGFLFGLDYRHGFSRIVPSASQSSLPRLRTHNTIWDFHLGWVFKL